MVREEVQGVKAAEKPDLVLVEEPGFVARLGGDFEVVADKFVLVCKNLAVVVGIGVESGG